MQCCACCKTVPVAGGMLSPKFLGTRFRNPVTPNIAQLTNVRSRVARRCIAVCVATSRQVKTIIKKDYR